MDGKKHRVGKKLVVVGALAAMMGLQAGNANAQTLASAREDASHVTSGDVKAYSQTEMARIVASVFGLRYGPAAVKIARCQSNLNPNARGANGAAGLFQLLPWAFGTYGSGNVYNPWDNSRAAYKLFRARGYSWAGWFPCKP